MLMARRARNLWSPLEVSALRVGVNIHGKGRWKAIKDDAQFAQILSARTSEDLRGKWRSLSAEDPLTRADLLTQANQHFATAAAGGVGLAAVHGTPSDALGAPSDTAPRDAIPLIKHHRIRRGGESLAALSEMDHPFHSSCQISTSAKLLALCVRRLDEKGEKLTVQCKRRRRLADEKGEKLNVNNKRRRRLDERGEKLNVRKKGRRITSLSSFPDELLLEILCKLPVRLLTRFKRVCKLWGDLISSEEFISLHVKKYEASVILVNSISGSDRFRRGHGSISPVYPPPNAISSVDFTLPDGFPQMTSACNGIVCLWESGHPDNIALWNPANKDLKIVPESKLPRQPKSKSKTGYFRVLFGYDDVRNDYKILRFFIGDVGCRCLELELYSLNSGLWKKADFSDHIREPGEFIEGRNQSTGGKTVSWFVSRKKETRVGRRWEVVLFDMCSERYEIVQVPVEAYARENLVLRCYEASIGVMDNLYRDQLWVLKDINSPPSGGLRSWKKIDLPKFPERFNLSVVGFWDEHILLLDTRTLRLIMSGLDRPSGDDVGFCRYLFINTATRYKESLVRLL